MKIIVGLGNPGSNYERTRHNAGAMAVDRFARRHVAAGVPRARFQSAALEGTLGGERFLLLKPTTYMNRSGAAVGEAVGFYKVDPARDLLVMVDDLALPCGQIRLRAGGSAGGHNGLADIQRALGTDAYPRCRIGIDASPPFMDPADYVLSRFASGQWALVEPAVERAADAAETFISSGITAAMNAHNTRKDRESPPPAPAQPAPPRPAPESPTFPTDQGSTHR